LADLKDTFIVQWYLPLLTSCSKMTPSLFFFKQFNSFSATSVVLKTLRTTNF